MALLQLLQLAGHVPSRHDLPDLNDITFPNEQLIPLAQPECKFPNVTTDRGPRPAAAVIRGIPLPIRAIRGQIRVRISGILGNLSGTNPIRVNIRVIGGRVLCLPFRALSWAAFHQLHHHRPSAKSPAHDPGNKAH